MTYINQKGTTINKDVLINPYRAIILPCLFPWGARKAHWDRHAQILMRELCSAIAW